MKYLDGILGPVALFLGFSTVGVADVPSGVSAFDKVVKPVLAKHCFSCHGPEKQKGNVRLDTLSPDLVKGTSAETWHDALDKINLGEMPPEDEPALSSAERSTLTSWISGELKRAAEVRRSTGGRVVLRRLTRYEYANTLRDMLGLDVDFARSLPPEPASPDGFKNNGRSLRMSPEQLEYYLKVAREALARVIVEGDAPEFFEQRVEESEKQRRIPGETANQLLPGSQFLAKFDKFPRKGTVRLRIHATTNVPEGAGLPSLHITMGVRADVKASHRTLGVVDAEPGEQTIELTARIEEFPLPGHNPKFPGLLVRLTNEYDDGSGFRQRAAKSKPKKTKKGEPPPPPDPDLAKQPRVHLHAVEFAGPIFASWPPHFHLRHLGGTFEKEEDETSRARQALESFLPLAWRRPAEKEDIDGLLALFREVRPGGPSFESAIRETFAMALVSPEFLYLLEPTAPKGEARPLTDHEIAARLSYFLWSTMPDDQLRNLADAGKLRQPEELERQVARMLKDDRHHQFVNPFTDQWLNLSGLTRVAVNPRHHPDFDDALKVYMRRETQLFFGEVLSSDQSALALLDSDFAMLNRPLAHHYGIEGPRGQTFERVILPRDSRRGGLLTHGSILLANSDGEQSHPIRRAVWLLDRLLGDPPAPPPPDVPELEADNPKFKNLSIREQMEVHRQKAACADCHKDIDPWGIAFEEYDAVGLHRETLPKGKPVDAHADLPDGSSLQGMVGLKKRLLAHDKERFAQALTEKLLAYALGRSLEFTDKETVAALTHEFTQEGYRLSALIGAIVKSNAFLNK